MKGWLNHGILKGHKEKMPKVNVKIEEVFGKIIVLDFKLDFKFNFNDRQVKEKQK